MQYLQERAVVDGDRPCVLYADIERTWAECVGTVARLAGDLADAGVRPGDRVLLACANSPTFLYGWFALRWLGATCVPLHTGAATGAITAMVRNAGIRTVLGDTALIDRVLAASPELGSRVVAFTDHLELEARVADRPAVEPAPTRPADECSILYTSGTTGTPKGVVLSENSFMRGGSILASSIGIDHDDRILVALPLFHTNPQVYAVSVAVTTGCSLVVLPAFEPASFLEQAARYRATGFTYVGTLLHLVLMKTPRVPATSLRFCTGGGAPPAVWNEVENRLGVRVHELYGMTEVGGWVTVTEAATAKIGACGRVRPDIELAIVDADDTVLSPGEIGQIVIRPLAPSVIFDGYNGQPELTLAKFGNLWFHTGDLGMLDHDGYLYFHGRADDMIRRGGENITPADIEAVVCEYPEVDEAAVVGVDDQVMGQEVKVVVVPRAGGTVEPGALADFLAERVPKFARPRYVEVRRELPRTPTQKILVKELRNIDAGVTDLRPRPTPKAS